MDDFARTNACCSLHATPLALWVILILILAVAFATYALGILIERKGWTTREADAPRSIAATISLHARTAQGAARANVPHFAQVLCDEIERLLGPVLKVGNKLGGPHGKLKKALDEVLHPKPAKAEPKKPAEGAGGSVSLADSVAVILNAPHQPAAPAAPAHADPIDTLRAAVDAVADYVTTEDFVSDLKAAQRALNTPTEVPNFGRPK
jgi:hypothetical protein